MKNLTDKHNFTFINNIALLLNNKNKKLKIKILNLKIRFLKNLTTTIYSEMKKMIRQYDTLNIHCCSFLFYIKCAVSHPN